MAEPTAADVNWSLVGEIERLGATIEQQAASLTEKDKEIERLREESAHRLKCWKDIMMKWNGTTTRAEQAERVFTDICEELGCKPDNEVALEAVAALKRALAEAVEVMRPLASAADDICEQSRDDQHIWEAPCAMNITRGHLRAARAFVAQHGSDSREGK